MHDVAENNALKSCRCRSKLDSCSRIIWSVLLGTFRHQIPPAVQTTFQSNESLKNGSRGRQG